MKCEQGGYTISTDKDKLEIEVITRFLAEESYWANRRTREQIVRAIDNSLCFGLFSPDRQIGFARVVTDFATFAYLGDVFVLREYRGLGLSKWLMEVITEHPELQGLRRWLLATKDAHGLYEKYGFEPLRFPDRWLETTFPGAY